MRQPATSKPAPFSGKKQHGEFASVICIPLRLLLSYRMQLLLLQSGCRKWLRILSQYRAIRMY